MLISVLYNTLENAYFSTVCNVRIVELLMYVVPQWFHGEASKEKP